MVGHLVPVGVERPRAMVGPGEVAELDLVNRLVGVDVGIEADLQQLVLLPPVDDGVEVHPPAARPQANVLDHHRIVELAFDPQRGEQGPGGDHVDVGRQVQMDRLKLVHAVDIPRVELAGRVLEHLELVAQPTGELAARLLVDDARDPPRAVELDADQIVLQPVGVRLDAAVGDDLRIIGLQRG